MRFLYTLQHALALSRSERRALTVLCSLLLLGQLALWWPVTHPPLDAVQLAAADSQFFHLAARAVEGGMAPETEAGRPAAPRTRAAAPGLPAQPIDINTADAALLERLPRVGPAMAQRILDYRATHGPFRRIEDLRQVRGIGEKTFEQIRPHVVVRE